jgi:tripartite-type tricarboxylate transporter receptor subunit TctC
VATMSEAGLPGVIAESWFGLVLSASTPAPIVARLQSALAAAQNDPAYIETLARQKASAGQIGPEKFAELVHRDVQKWHKVVQGAGIKFD